ncbi:hypothetical protein C7M84_007171 [Penaeus vannamei]|uniref:Uncharacterized protein n=1 Tax=Penaeus vannamei TaxID=6689 RepID=A0A423TCY4_PENVA|nr:hypothetical protein C7M84_007171 [Penaeus vannamei]
MGVASPLEHPIIQTNIKVGQDASEHNHLEATTIMSTMKTLVISLLCVLVTAEQKREAEPGFGIGHPFIRPYGIGYGYSSAITHHPFGSHSSVQSYNHLVKKREAEPGFGIGYPLIRPYGIGYGYSSAITHHPFGSHSSVQSYNHLVKKREAEPGFGIGHPFIRPYGIGYGYSSAITHHPFGSHSSVQSYNHLIKKRDAEADPSFPGLLGYASLQYPGYGLGYKYSHASLPLHYGIY